MNIKLIIGLGNNNPKYENTYHNVGFLMADYLNASSLSAVTLGAKADVKIPIEKSGGYMNEAGASVRALAKKYGMKPENLLIIHDDSDIYLGNYKLSFNRGSAGHKGVQNIIDQLKTKEFWRLRIGIRPKPKSAKTPRAKAEEFVLKTIAPASKKILEKVFESAVVAIKDL